MKNTRRDRNDQNHLKLKENDETRSRLLKSPKIEGMTGHDHND